MSSSTLERGGTSRSPNAPTRVAGQLGWWWSNRTAAVALIAAAAVVVGLASAWATPRGPLTGVQVLVTTLVVFALGVGGGLVLGSRWSMALVPVAYLLAFEVGRIAATAAYAHLGRPAPAPGAVVDPRTPGAVPLFDPDEEERSGS